MIDSEDVPPVVVIEVAPEGVELALGSVTVPPCCVGAGVFRFKNQKSAPPAKISISIKKRYFFIGD